MRLMFGKHQAAMLGGFALGVLLALLSAQSALPRATVIDDSTTQFITNNFNSQWIANADGGILFDGGVEIGDGLRYFGRLQNDGISDAGIAISIPRQAKICLNHDGGTASTCSLASIFDNNSNITLSANNVSLGNGSGNVFFSGNAIIGANARLSGGVTNTTSSPLILGTEVPAVANVIEVRHATSSANRLMMAVNNGGALASYIDDGGMAYRMEPSASIAWASDGGVAVPHLNLGGIPAASLPTCNSSTAGSVRYDSTNNTLRLCNGTTWLTITAS